MLIDEFNARARTLIASRSEAEAAAINRALLDKDGDEGVFHFATIRQVLLGNTDFGATERPDPRKGFKDVAAALDYFRENGRAAKYIGPAPGSWSEYHNQEWLERAPAKIAAQFPDALIDFQTVEGILIATANSMFVSEGMHAIERRRQRSLTL